MAKITIAAPDSRRTPTGIDLTLVSSDDPPVAEFGAYVVTSRNRPGGEMNLTFGVPFDQVMNAMPLMRFVGGVVFKITVERVPMEELPEPGWK